MASPFPIQLLAGAHGTAVEDGPRVLEPLFPHRETQKSSWLLPSPALDAVAIWGSKQQMKISLFCNSDFQRNK